MCDVGQTASLSNVGMCMPWPTAGRVGLHRQNAVSSLIDGRLSPHPLRVCRWASAVASFVCVRLQNFFDAGSCIDGRLTSAWNWCSNLHKKPYYALFKLAGFVGFDGDFK